MRTSTLELLLQRTTSATSIYSALDPYNVSLVGGRVMEVGVGGLMLGGGLSYLSDLYGLACDNVVSFAVVLANGSAVQATYSQHPELFWALKGGSNNFGIVTEFTAKTFPISQAWGGMQVFSLDHASDVLGALYEYQEAENKDLYANCIINVLPINSTLFLTLIYLKPVEKPKAFAPFYDLTPLLDKTGFYTLHELMAMFPVGNVPRWTWYENSLEPNKGLYKDIGRALTATNDSDIKRIAGFPSGTLVAALQPIDKNVALAGEERGGNPLGIEAKNQLWFSVNVGWDGQEHDAAASAAIESLNFKMESLIKEADAGVDYVFMNDANSKQAVIKSYGGKNVQRLRDIQRVYDPDQVFQKLFPL
ncbi:FAD binding domain-containing protein [Hirsutella rhossiliensis]|uniref:FAD binding domain-containing protein n=1 Tax=Hirsutella rhossiliensis TaxID=111463 RepID=A0A9P8SNH2_9HYPO|nr:FAD binding domain-containing protein [Hirsutella rhossiliensis]KAH0967880.1 FAD binding domain-containing protein [Hirsutella rhossiliensis]